MKTYRELKNEEAWRRYGQSYTDCLEWVDRRELAIMDEQIAKDFALEVAKEALRNAADSATMEPNGMLLQIDKESIISETNIPQL